MKVLDYIPDQRIKSCNASVIMTYREYIDIAKETINDNEFQRRKVITSSIKKTLKEDIKQYCTIPAIVLGIKSEKLPASFDYNKFNDEEALIRFIKEKSVIILDGLQRTYVLLELFDEDPTGEWINQQVRCEVYIGLDKLGLLYRMLTLNTGQTTMSTRHLLEILYYEYLDIDLEGLKLILDKEEAKIKDPSREFKFKEVIEGYNSFLEGKEIPIERPDILSNIETINNLTKTDDQKEGFKSFLQLYHKLLVRINEIYKDFVYDQKVASASQEFKLSSDPFAQNTLDIFAKSQSLTGLGAAINFLKRNRNVSFESLSEELKQLNATAESDPYLILRHFDYIRNNSKKVGNDQRYYFKNFYQNLFDPKSELHHNILLASVEAYNRVTERIEG